MQKINDKFVWSNDNINFIKCSACKQCWIKSRKNVYQSHKKCADESNALLVGRLYTQNFDNLFSRCRRKNMCERKAKKKKMYRNRTHWIATKTA